METHCVLGWFLLCLLSVSECIATKVIGIEGQNVTLPCKYNTKKHGVSAICWGRGAIPNSGCYKEIISSDGIKVTWRSSIRYHLFGELKTGDVSLTIFNVTEKDSGQYGCRVHVYGLWNDEKHHVNLNIEKAPVPTTSQAPAKVTITQQTTDNHTHCHVTTNSTEYSDTSTLPYSESILEQMTGHKLPVILVSMLLVLTGVVIVSVLVVLRKRWKTIATGVQIPEHSGSTVLYSNSESSLGVHTRDMAVENVYQIDDNERDVYEECHRQSMDTSPQSCC
ncbi:T-cell immunoglobulin and mucin domain-containing protein 4-like isoform X2 [Salvelinus fontinalis]|uniref:T-cell immunoglobulin and mucin domain-containing protein 4-like isoform X2 n=1 Tax=Salvelinus fontinalis TaxID=8038 RepID=UPI002484FA4C|nr:T-cell immunoglobulin and mucin domain-containing protein 4-like isoform X2 [Salvelinus fontinalis]